MDSLTNYLFVSASLFCLGLYGVITRRNAVAVLMGVELILNSANINFVAFARFSGMNMAGHVYALFVIVLAAAEAAVALAIIINIFNNFVNNPFHSSTIGKPCYNLSHCYFAVSQLKLKYIIDPISYCPKSAGFLQ